MILPAEDTGENFQLDQERENIAAQIKQNLLKVQEKMKKFADKKVERLAKLAILPTNPPA
jgi:hypothetical protein